MDSRSNMTNSPSVNEINLLKAKKPILEALKEKKQTGENKKQLSTIITVYEEVKRTYFTQRGNMFHFFNINFISQRSNIKRWYVYSSRFKMGGVIFKYSMGTLFVLKGAIFKINLHTISSTQL